MTNEYFYEIKTKVNFENNLKTIISNSKNVKNYRNGFNVIKLNLNIFSSYDALLKLIIKFKIRPVIIEMKPMTFYKFHIDEHRTACLNLLIDGVDSQTFFGINTEQVEVTSLIELIYKPNTFYILNTQKKHAVLNRNNFRYVLSLGIYKPFSYEEILNYCKENKL